MWKWIVVFFQLFNPYLFANWSFNDISGSFTVIPASQALTFSHQCANEITKSLDMPVKAGDVVLAPPRALRVGDQSFTIVLVQNQASDSQGIRNSAILLVALSDTGEWSSNAFRFDTLHPISNAGPIAFEIVVLKDGSVLPAFQSDANSPLQRINVGPLIPIDETQIAERGGIAFTEQPNLIRISTRAWLDTSPADIMRWAHARVHALGDSGRPLWTRARSVATRYAGPILFLSGMTLSSLILVGYHTFFQAPLAHPPPPPKQNEVAIVVEAPPPHKIQIEEPRLQPLPPPERPRPVNEPEMAALPPAPLALLEAQVELLIRNAPIALEMDEKAKLRKIVEEAIDHLTTLSKHHPKMRQIRDRLADAYGVPIPQEANVNGGPRPGFVRIWRWYRWNNQWILGYTDHRIVVGIP